VGFTPKNYLGVLFKTLRSFHDKTPKIYRGKINYGRISKQHGQFWYPTISTQLFVYDLFFTSQGLKQYYEHLPEIGKGGEERYDSPVCFMKATSETDPFGKLPAELLMMILMHLPVQSISNLRFAGVAAVQVQLPGSFWKQKLKRDMPWLWDFPYKEPEQSSKNPDWLQIYKDIYMGSKGNGKSPFFNLANRHRVWRISEQIAPRFAMFQEERGFAEARQRERLLVEKRQEERGNELPRV
jgi:hypothetical protein